jgi:hypothetical protein
MGGLEQGSSKCGGGGAGLDGEDRTGLDGVQG